jgi:FkbM family methyltransferase
MQNRIRKFLDRHPALHQPAYMAWAAAMKSKNFILDFAAQSFDYVPYSLSDRGADRWVITEVFPQKTGGFFLEIGAADGFSDSNTYVLEKRYHWSGICVEPNPELFAALTKRHMRSCICVPCAVDEERGFVDFVLAGQASGLVLGESDNSPAKRPEFVRTARSLGRVITVEVLPLAELLDKYSAPDVIDYFSLDVEGLETRILRHFPFDRYRFLSMTVERPTPQLNTILFRNGYHFVRNSLYDTFYIHESLPGFDRIKRETFEQLPAKDF